MLMMLPFEAPTIFEGIHKSYFRMPRVVKDQRSKFENDDLFRQLSHESAVKYTGFKDRPLEERQMKFIANCQEGHTEVSVVQSGNQFTLMFNPTANPAYNNEGCDFDKELGKVHIKSGFILNGVCVLWRGWVDLQRLEGFGCLEFDEYRAYLEEAMLKQQIDKQQTCNNSTNHQQSPIGRLNHHPLGGVHPLGVATNQMPPVGLNPSCLGPPPPPVPTVGSVHPGMPQQLPPVSLADTAAHYGNAAIAAAAAAAFHQALSVGAPPQSLHGLGPAPSTNGGGVGGGPPPPSLAPPSSTQHLPYTNGSINVNGSTIIPTNNMAPPTRGSPPSSQLHTQTNNNNRINRSPERERDHEHQQRQHHNHRQATKRPHEEQTQIDDVDVISKHP